MLFVFVMAVCMPVRIVAMTMRVFFVITTAAVMPVKTDFFVAIPFGVVVTVIVKGTIQNMNNFLNRLIRLRFVPLLVAGFSRCGQSQNNDDPQKNKKFFHDSPFFSG